MFYKEKGFYISLLAGIVAIVAFAVICLNMVGNSPDAGNNSGDENLVVEATEEPQATVVPTKEPETEQASKVIPAKTEKPMETPKAKVASVTKDHTDNLHFNQESGLLWPVSGNVILDYSPDKVIYFKTLAQYRTNSGIVIQSKVGTKVKASTDGVVKSISKDDENGNMVTVSIGDNYTVSYGQLKNITVKKGDQVKEGQVIGKIADPTNYYSVEGANLFYQVKNGKETVNPMIFLR